MRNHKLSQALVICLALGSAGIASAQEAGAHGPGVGVEENLAGLTGATFVYDMGNLRFDLLFGLRFASTNVPGGNDVTIFGFGGRVFYVVHHSGMADFSLGGGLGLIFASAGVSNVNVDIEGLGQARIFLAPNFCFMGTLGLAVAITDKGAILEGPVIAQGAKTGFGIGGELLGSIGFAYFFK
ncbi:MAG TPA: hypothetical protein VKE22_20800 [Haliangiales bacterium]|nr:hypothetical protein [Haliangiales bacterium]